MIICVAFLLFGLEPSVQLPPTMNAKPGRLIQITAKTEQKAVKWFLFGEDADLIVMESTRQAIFSATRIGQYKVIAWTAQGDIPSDPAICLINVGDAPSPDQLQTTIQAIYSAIPENNKAQNKAALVLAYKSIASKIPMADAKTISDLYSFARSIVKDAVPDNALVAVRNKFAEELSRTLPTDPDTILDAGLREKAVLTFNRIASVLESVQ